MLHLVWSLPLLAVLGLLATGRASTVGAGWVGAGLMLVVAMTAAPTRLDATAAVLSLGAGGWFAAVVASVIVAGLFFRDIVAGLRPGGVAAGPIDPQRARRQIFSACFLVGPFAEAATGFGVGQIVVLALIVPLGVPALPAVLLALFSQMLVAWGALAVGTMAGAHLSGLTPVALGWRSGVLTLPLLSAYLPLLWHWAALGGHPSDWRMRLDDALWTAAAGLLLIGANLLVGAEVAAVAALGPLIVLRHWRDVRPSVADWRAAAHAAMPYAVLVVILTLTRAIPPLQAALATIAIQPFAGGPVWRPVLHPFLWLLAVGIGAALVAGQGARIAAGAADTWRRGRKAVLATLLFMVMAQLMADSGVAAALAYGLRDAFGPWAAIVTPVSAALGGFLTGSNAASNGLLMGSQVALAAATGLDMPWLAAIQNTTGSALTMLSPIRLTMGCALLGRPELERPAYRLAWPAGALPIAIMMLAAVILVLAR